MGVLVNRLVMGTLLVLPGCVLHPVPLTMREVGQTVLEDREALFAGQEIPVAPIGLHEAMARALRYNLEARVQMLEKVVAIADADLSDLNLLPRLAANAGFTSRNLPEATSGYSLTSDTPTTSFTTSQDLRKRVADLGVTWSILDFGLGYFQARQTADRVLIARENRRKLAHTQIQEVQTAYWRAVGAQELREEIDVILQDAKKGLEDAYQVEQERLRPQLEIMRYQRSLLDIVRQLEALREEMNQARNHLAKLINLPPGSPFTLREPAEGDARIPTIGMSVEEMEYLALRNRPEIRLEMYNARIGLNETRKAILKLVPNLEFRVGRHYDSNSYAMHSVWDAVGLQVTGNLMRLIGAPGELRLADKQEELARMRRLAANMAIFTQVHLAYRQYLDTAQKFENSDKISHIDQRIFRNVALETGNEAQNRLERIRAASQAVISRLQRNKAFAEVQNALGMLHVSLGVDLLPDVAPDADLAALTQAVRTAMDAWKEGLSLPPPGAKPTESPPPAEGMPPLDVDPTFARESMTLATVRAGSATPKAAPFEKRSPPAEKQPPPPVPESTPPAVVGVSDETIRQRAREWSAAWAKHDAREFFRFYSDAFVPDGNWSRQQWQDAYHLLFDASRAVRTELADLAVEVESPTQARAFVTLRLDQDGTRNEVRKTLLFREEAKEWRIIGELAGFVFATPGKSAAPRAAAPSAPAKTAPNVEQGEIWETVQSWAEAWSAQDLEKYLDFYSRRFKPPQALSQEEWHTRRIANFKWRRKMRIQVEAIRVVRPRETHEPLRVEFTQHYYYDRFHTVTGKTLLLTKEEGAWRIIGEEIRPVAP
ncbi:MAG: TolC family protein [Magnetococcales bacterium]|nr:TolC family protein [Magnetococcales bacterium]